MFFCQHAKLNFLYDHIFTIRYIHNFVHDHKSLNYIFVCIITMTNYVVLFF